MDLNQKTIQEALLLLGRTLAEDAVQAEITVVGGSAMALAYASDRVTRDVDAYFEPRDLVLETAQAVGEVCGLPPNWLSDGVATVWPWFEDREPTTYWEAPGISLKVVSAPYLLAMKALASRKSTGDLEDAALLCNQLGITTENQLEQLLQDQVPGSSPFGAQKLFFEDIIDRAAQLRRIT
jgi:hypothetical protein